MTDIFVLCYGIALRVLAEVICPDLWNWTLFDIGIAVCLTLGFIYSFIQGLLARKNTGAVVCQAFLPIIYLLGTQLLYHWLAV